MLERMMSSPSSRFVALVICMIMGAVMAWALIGLGIVSADPTGITPVVPSSDTNAVGTEHTVTATVSGTGSFILTITVTGANSRTAFVSLDFDALSSSVTGSGVVVTFGATSSDPAEVVFKYTAAAAGSDVIEYTAGTFTENGGKTWLDIASLLPATDFNAIETSHTVTATITPVTEFQKVLFEVISGPNTGDTVTDETDGGGQATFTYLGDVGAGTDIIKACLDLDGGGACDGATVAVTASKTWLDIALSPAEDLNQVNATHTVTATVTDGAFGVSGVNVFFEVFSGGPNTGVTGSATTDANGEAPFTYTGAGGTGTDTIRACIDIDPVDGACDSPATPPDVDKEWVRVVDKDGFVGLNGGLDCTGTDVPVFTTIQDAVDDAVDDFVADDTIQVCTGIYVENVVIPGELIGLNLLGISGSDPPTVDATGSGSAITIAATASGVTVDNFKVTNSGTDTGDAGILVLGDDNTITNNLATSNGNDGIQVSGEGNDIGGSGNTVTLNGGHGINVIGKANNIEGNTVNSNTGDGIHIDGTSDNNNVHENIVDTNTGEEIDVDGDHNNIHHNTVCSDEANEIVVDGGKNVVHQNISDTINVSPGPPKNKNKERKNFGC